MSNRFPSPNFSQWNVPTAIFVRSNFGRQNVPSVVLPPPGIFKTRTFKLLTLLRRVFEKPAKIFTKSTKALQVMFWRTQITGNLEIKAKKYLQLKISFAYFFSYQNEHLLTAYELNLVLKQHFSFQGGVPSAGGECGVGQVNIFYIFLFLFPFLMWIVVKNIAWTCFWSDFCWGLFVDVYVIRTLVLGRWCGHNSIWSAAIHNKVPHLLLILKQTNSTLA